jgi:predicted ArsR family transcriptional regulator
MRPTRQNIISMLQTKHSLSAQEISRALHLTPANIRHHLSILEEEGVIEVASQRKTPGRGRPIQVYTLTQQILAHNLDALAGVLLEELVQNDANLSLSDVYARVASRLAQPEIPLNPSFTKRLYLTVQRLNEMHYQARWEAHADAPRIFLEHCPYAAILPDHPELCQIDAYLLNKLLDHPVRLTSKLDRDSHGMLFCLFTAMEKIEPMVQ